MIPCDQCRGGSMGHEDYCPYSVDKTNGNSDLVAEAPVTTIPENQLDLSIYVITLVEALEVAKADLEYILSYNSLATIEQAKSVAKATLGFIEPALADGVYVKKLLHTRWKEKLTLKPIPPTTNGEIE